MKSFLNWLVGLFGFVVKRKDEVFAGVLGEPLKLVGNKTLLVFKLGSLENKIIPTPETIKNLEDKIVLIQEQLKSNEPTCVTLVWGPDIEVKSYKL
jgi:hypothetical protein